MTDNILSNIVENKKKELILRKQKTPVEQLTKNLKPSQKSFYNALNNQHSDFIFECKKASPSNGLIREKYNLDEILSVYQDYASAISVLTDYTFFKGEFKHLQKVTQTVKQPVLCKDFFIDTYQVYEARYYGANAILLMLSVLDDTQYQELAKVANELNLDILTEVHNSQELKRALNLKAKIIGINNRNLKDLSINLSVTEALISEVPHDVASDIILISESGINNRQDIQRLSPIVNGFLIGSSIMSKKNIREQCKKLIFGNIKVCGIKDPKIAKHAFNNGAIYGGLIFYPPSPRNVSLEQAKEITLSVPLKYVGVFVNHELSDLVSIAKKLSLTVIQLHGSEDENYISEVKNLLPDCKVWKSMSIKNIPLKNQNLIFKNNNIDAVLLDTHSEQLKGGSGNAFDWSLLDELTNEEKNKVVIAGGLNSSNINQASQYNTFTLDVNSGVESSKGIKDNTLITELFHALRA
jgi:indole-3-glycerol phosphate synthase/phosphoribosylanthranilate isomerase